MKEWYTAREINRIYGTYPQKISYWRKTGKIQFKEISPGCYLYRLLEDHPTNPQIREHVVYSRVSTSVQKEDLFRQTRILSEHIAAKGHQVGEIFEDIGSGMSFGRDRFRALLQKIVSNQVDTVYITYKDRVARFGFELFEEICRIHGVEVRVLNATQERDYQTELTEDLVAVLHHFSMKMYSNRRKSLKKLKSELLLDTGSEHDTK